MIKQVDMINKMNKCQHLWWSSGNGAETSGQWLLACQEHFVSHTCTHTSMHTHTLTRSHIIWRENYSLLIFVNWVGFICLSFQCLNWFFFSKKRHQLLPGRQGGVLEEETTECWRKSGWGRFNPCRELGKGSVGRPRPGDKDIQAALRCLMSPLRLWSGPFPTTFPFSMISALLYLGCVHGNRGPGETVTCNFMTLVHLF